MPDYTPSPLLEPLGTLGYLIVGMFSIGMAFVYMSFHRKLGEKVTIQSPVLLYSGIGLMALSLFGMYLKLKYLKV